MKHLTRGEMKKVMGGSPLQCQFGDTCDTAGACEAKSDPNTGKTCKCNPNCQCMCVTVSTQP